MKKQLFLIIICSILGGETNLHGQSHEYPIISLRAAPGQPVPDSIVVLYFKGIINGNMGNRSHLRPSRDEKDVFTFTLTEGQPVHPFVIDVYYGKEIQISKHYYAQSGDSITIYVSKGEQKEYGNNGRIRPVFRYVGAGADKYRLASELHGQRVASSLRERERLNELRKMLQEKNDDPVRDSLLVEDYLNGLLKNVSGDIELCRGTIYSNRYEIDLDIAGMFAYEFSGWGNFRWGISHFFFSTQVFQRFSKRAADFYFEHIEGIRPIAGDRFFKYMLTYRDNLARDFIEGIAFKTNKKGSPLSTQYATLKALKNSELRDIMITKFFHESWPYVTSLETRDSCLRDALTFIRHPELMAALKDQLNFAKGSDVYDFTFFDPEGDPLSLSDMKGKVFLLDFYYYGCGACASFARQFDKEVYPEFKNNRNFEVLSVNTDKSPETWKKAVNSGLYAVKDARNLATGKAFDHPIFEHYNIYSLPFILLVGRDGKLVARISGQKSEVIAGQIREALSETIGRSGVSK